MTGPTPVLTLCSLDPVLREAAEAALLCDLPEGVVVRHDLDAERGVLRRRVVDRSGLLEDVTLPLEHACLSCALREDVLPTVARWADGWPGRPPSAVVLALPVAAEPLPVLRALATLPAPSAAGGGPRVAGVAAVVAAEGFEHDLLGDDLLAERGLGLSAGDRRSVGEALAHQVECADALLLPAPAPPRVVALLDHLVGEAAVRVPLHGVDVARLLVARRDRDDPRGDVRRAEATGAPAREGVWTVDLRSWRPLHPDRLREGLRALAGGPVRGRGRFWLPTRPESVCAWDGVGGQLGIGDAGRWGEPPSTRLVVTGVDRDPREVLQAFDEALLTDVELVGGLEPWRGREDGLDAWLGRRQGDAA